jgi:Holliday junction resolvasome RuvABC endonuclease subunit
VTLLAIDPGTEQSGWVVLDDENRIVSSGVHPNTDVLTAVREYEDVAIEMIASYGMPVGREVFETCVWVGRYIEAASEPDTVIRVTRNEVKNHLCGSSKAKDPNVRQALIDLFGPPGKKSAPGPTFGVTSHAWAALGVAATVRKLERGTTT